jgi:hypothetical protein
MCCERSRGEGARVKRTADGWPRRMLLIAALSLALAACSTYEERVAGHCARLGEGPGTAYYHACVERTEELQQRNQEMWSGATAAGARLLAPQPTINVYQPRY